MLDGITFSINNDAKDDSGNPQIYLPNLVKRFMDPQQLIEKRKQKQVDIARKKGRFSPLTKNLETKFSCRTT